MAKPALDAHSIVYLQGKKLRSISYRRIRSRIERLIAKQPKVNYYLELACLEARKHNWDRAQAAIESAFRLEEENRDAHLLMAQILESEQKIAEAKEKYQTLLESHPDFGKGYREFGRFLNAYDSSDKKLAVNALFKALELNPKDPLSHTFLAEIYLHKNRRTQAILHLEIAERCQELEPLSHERLARQWMKVENYEKAAKQWKLALKMFPRDKVFRMQFRKAQENARRNNSNRVLSSAFWKKWGFR